MTVARSSFDASEPRRRDRRPRRVAVAVAIAAAMTLSGLGACSNTQDADAPTTTLTKEAFWAKTFCESFDDLGAVIDATRRTATATPVPGTNPRDALSGILEDLGSTAHGFAGAAAAEGKPAGDDFAAVVGELDGFDQRSQARVIPLKVRVNGAQGDDPANTAPIGAATVVALDEMSTDLQVTVATIGAGNGAKVLQPRIEGVPACERLRGALGARPAGSVPPTPPPPPELEPVPQN